jgi:iron complex outermembrane receptor protein
MLALAAPAETSAGEIEDFEELDLEQLLDVVFTAAKHEQDIGASPSAITVITREDIQASGATTLIDLLRMVPGMEVIITTPAYTGITARLKWTYESQFFLVLVDGREANLELLGFPPFEIQPILLEEIERIEVIRGPGSALYGANALVGVVSITTREVPEKTSARTSLGVGETGTRMLGAFASTRLGGWGFKLSGGFDITGKFTDPRAPGRRIWKLRSAAEYRWADKQRILIEGGISTASGPIESGVGPLDADMSLRTLRLSYESPDLGAQVYWSQIPLEAAVQTDLVYNQIRLASFVPVTLDAHVVNGDVHWNLPTFWDPLLIIIGGGGRLSYLGSDQLLDSESFTDITSPDYRKPGVSHLEARAGAFVHGEFTPADWMTVTGGLRFDYNTITGTFLSPRLATVFQPIAGQFLRAGVARAFRKPAFVETNLHIMVDFPPDSPLTGGDRDNFQEFMTRIVGNPDLKNEEVWAFEVGYLGRFLDSKLSVALDLYYNIYKNEAAIRSRMVTDPRGLPDLDNSTFMFANSTRDLAIIGSELCIRYKPTKNISLMVSWTHRELWRIHDEKPDDEGPRNMITLGGRFSTDWGLVGSLYIFTRSEFRDKAVANPAGLLEPILKLYMENTALVLGRLGWKTSVFGGVELEAGLKLFLPIAPDAEPYFRYREKGGGFTPTGDNFGGDQLARMVSAYLEGSF